MGRSNPSVTSRCQNGGDEATYPIRALEQVLGMNGVDRVEGFPALHCRGCAYGSTVLPPSLVSAAILMLSSSMEHAAAANHNVAFERREGRREDGGKGNQLATREVVVSRAIDRPDVLHSACTLLVSHSHIPLPLSLSRSLPLPLFLLWCS